MSEEFHASRLIARRYGYPSVWNDGATSPRFRMATGTKRRRPAGRLNSLFEKCSVYAGLNFGNVISSVTSS